MGNLPPKNCMENQKKKKTHLYCIEEKGPCRLPKCVFPVGCIGFYPWCSQILLLAGVKNKNKCDYCNTVAGCFHYPKVGSITFGTSNPSSSLNTHKKNGEKK